MWIEGPANRATGHCKYRGRAWPTCYLVPALDTSCTCGSGGIVSTRTYLTLLKSSHSHHMSACISANQVLVYPSLANDRQILSIEEVSLESSSSDCRILGILFSAAILGSRELAGY